MSLAHPPARTRLLRIWVGLNAFLFLNALLRGHWMDALGAAGLFTALFMLFVEEREHDAHHCDRCRESICRAHQGADGACHTCSVRDIDTFPRRGFLR